MAEITEGELLRMGFEVYVPPGEGQWHRRAGALYFERHWYNEKTDTHFYEQKHPIEGGFGHG